MLNFFRIKLQQFATMLKKVTKGNIQYGKIPSIASLLQSAQKTRESNSFYVKQNRHDVNYFEKKCLKSFTYNTKLCTLDFFSHGMCLYA